MGRRTRKCVPPSNSTATTTTAFSVTKPPYRDLSVLAKAVSDDDQMKKLFKVWRRIVGRSYSLAQKEKRFQIFKYNAKRYYSAKIAGEDCYGLNVFADRTDEEVTLMGKFSLRRSRRRCRSPDREKEAPDH